MSLANVTAAPQALVQLVTPDQVNGIMADRNVPAATKFQAIAGCFRWFQVQRDNDKAQFERVKADYLRQIATLRTSLEQAQKATQDVQGQLGTANQQVENLQKEVNDKQGQIDTLEEQQRVNQRSVDREIERLNKTIQDNAAAELREKQVQDQKAKELRQKRIDKITAELSDYIKKYDRTYQPFKSTMETQFNLHASIYYQNVLNKFKTLCKSETDPDEALKKAYAAYKEPKIGFFRIYY